MERVFWSSGLPRPQNSGQVHRHFFNDHPGHLGKHRSTGNVIGRVTSMILEQLQHRFLILPLLAADCASTYDICTYNLYRQYRKNLPWGKALGTCKEERDRRRTLPIYALRLHTCKVICPLCTLVVTL